MNMNIDTFIGLFCLVILVVSHIIRKWCEENVYIRPKKYRVEYWIKRKCGIK
jgi:hypothetical protein